MFSWEYRLPQLRQSPDYTQPQGSQHQDTNNATSLAVFLFWNPEPSEPCVIFTIFTSFTCWGKSVIVSTVSTSCTFYLTVMPTDYVCYGSLLTEKRLLHFLINSLYIYVTTKERSTLSWLTYIVYLWLLLKTKQLHIFILHPRFQDTGRLQSNWITGKKWMIKYIVNMT
jgi:hypothetical protein